MSLDYDESYHGSNSSPSFAMAAIVAMTFHNADGLHLSLPEPKPGQRLPRYLFLVLDVPILAILSWQN
jgi:hypothetical protein